MCVMSAAVLFHCSQALALRICTPTHQNNENNAQRNAGFTQPKMTLDEFLQPEDPSNPCPIKLNDSYWMGKLQRLIVLCAYDQENLKQTMEQVQRLQRELAGTKERLRMCNEALVARVLATENAAPVKKRPAKKKRAAKKGRPRAKGVIESG